MLAEPSVLSRPKIDAMMRAIVAAHSAKLDWLAAAAKTDAGFDAGDAERTDRYFGWAYRLLDSQGSGAVVRPQDREAMMKAGFSETVVDLVQCYLVALRWNDLVPTPPGKLAVLFDGQGVQPTTVNIALAQQAHYRGMSLALFNTGERYRGEVPDADEIVAEAVQTERPAAAPAYPASPTTSAVAAPVAVADAPPGPPAAKRVDDDIVVIGEKLIEARNEDENWCEKTQRQARQIYKLMRRFMIEEQKLDGALTSLAQEHVAAFVDFLRKEI